MLLQENRQDAKHGNYRAAVVLLAMLLQGCPRASNDEMVQVQQTRRVRLQEGELAHLVGPQERLSDISRLYGVDDRAIAARNRLGGESLRPGDLVAIPAEGSSQQGASYDEGTPAREVVGSVGRGEGRFAWPVRGTVARRYGEATEVGPARGIEIEAAAGAEVRAAKSGRVRYVTETLRGLGKVVVLDHGGEEWTLYGHLGAIRVAAGAEVKQGQCIGVVGRTGRAASDRLDFRVYRRGRPVDPLALLPRSE